ncbi:unnamed protein product, partial [Polarella glacialis]
CTAGTSLESEDFADVCRLFKVTGRPADSDLASRPAGYPESYFSRFPLPREVVRLVIGKLQTGDVYNAALHYPLPEHRSHGLSAQAGLLYVTLFFDPRALSTDFVAMREIVDRHFGDAWVVSYALGCTADLMAMWAPYPAAMQALGAAITPTTVRQLQDQHLERMTEVRLQLQEYLTEGVLSEELVSQKTSAMLSCLRQANTSIRWLLLQPTTSDPKLKAVCKDSSQMKEQLLQALVDTALMEEKVCNLLAPLVQRRDSDWEELKASASQAMDDLAVYFSGEHALRRNVRNEELESWFRGLQQRIDELNFGGQENSLSLSRKIAQLSKALGEVALFHGVSQQPQILHFLADARQILQKMLRTANLSEDTLRTIETVADLSYAWKALGAYREAMRGLLAQSPDSVKGLRALFLKLASILEAPLRRIRQSGNESHKSLVSGYYSARLVEFMRSVLQEIPRLIFGLLGELSTLDAARLPSSLHSRVSVLELQSYAQQSEQANHKFGALTQRIALLMRGIRETDVAVLGAILVEPREVLLDGLRREVAGQIEALTSSRQDLALPLEALSVQSEALRQSFEHVQDYLGVSGLQLWHQEFGRVVRFLLHMEEHALLRRRLPAPSCSPHHDPSAPIAFPDASASINSGDEGSFISRTAAMLLSLTAPKAAMGGLHGEWRSLQSGSALLDGLIFEAMRKALGPPGIAAVSRLLGLRAAGRARQVFSGCRVLLKDGEVQSTLQKAKAAKTSSGAAATKALKSASSRISSQVGPLADALAGLGQVALLRRRLAALLRLRCRLDAPLAGGALSVLDAAALAETLELDNEAEEAPDTQLPSASPEEWQIRFRRWLARAGELPGLADPMRQLLIVVPEGTTPADLDILLVLVLFISYIVQSQC